MNLSMGGYGLYVWPAYFITLLVFFINFYAAFREKNRIKAFIKNNLVHDKIICHPRAGGDPS